MSVSTTWTTKTKTKTVRTRNRTTTTTVKTVTTTRVVDGGGDHASGDESEPYPGSATVHRIGGVGEDRER